MVVRRNLIGAVKIETVSLHGVMNVAKNNRVKYAVIQISKYIMSVICAETDILVPDVMIVDHLNILLIQMMMMIVLQTYVISVETSAQVVLII
jgi:hypothetical protein